MSSAQIEVRTLWGTKMKINARFSTLVLGLPLAAALAVPVGAQCSPPGNLQENAAAARLDNAPPNPSVRQEKPKPSTITIPAGTSVLIRMISKVDSSKNRVGDYFHASLETPLRVDDTVLAPKGADVYGKLARVKDAGKISGAPELTLELTGVRVGEDLVQIDSTSYDVVGKGRGGQSARRIGGGAALGAIIGGIAGGGAGAAIGAGVGAGAGTAVQLSTHGERIRIPPETLLEFKTEQPVDAPLPPDVRN
jgi:hypothetical protein